MLTCIFILAPLYLWHSSNSDENITKEKSHDLFVSAINGLSQNVACWNDVVMVTRSDKTVEQMVAIRDQKAWPSTSSGSRVCHNRHLTHSHTQDSIIRVYIYMPCSLIRGGGTASGSALVQRSSESYWVFSTVCPDDVTFSARAQQNKKIIKY